MDRLAALNREIQGRFPRDQEGRLLALTVGWHVVFLAAWLGWAVGGLPFVAFLLLGLCAYVRDFNRAHESFHGTRAPASLRWLRHIGLVVNGPLQLPWDALLDNHIRHHLHPADPELDPDHFLNRGPWWRAMVNATLQPEIAWVAHVRRKGVSGAVIGQVVLNSAVLLAVLLIGGPWGLLGYVVVSRLGSLSSWFIFDWILHHPGVWGTYGRLPVPGILRPLWIVLFSADNLRGVEHHHLHHDVVTVRDRDLPALSRWLAERGIMGPEAG